MNDLVGFSAIVIAFAVALTAHLAIVFGLFQRPPRWRAALALVAFPAAPYLGIRERMWIRVAAWVVGVVGYGVARGLFR